MADFRGEPLERARDDAERREEHRVPVARNDLRRHGLDREPKLLRDMGFDLGADIGKGSDRARYGAGRDLRPGIDEPRPGARELGIEAGKLDAERRRLGVDAMAAPDHGRALELEGALL